VVTFGASMPLAASSTFTPPGLFVTTSRCKAEAGATPLPGWSAAEAISTIASSGRMRPSNCFRISYLPIGGSFSPYISSNSNPGLNGRGGKLFRHFTRKGLAQAVLHGFLENDGIAGDLHHVTVEYRIVFPQKIRLVQIVGHYCDKACVGMN